MPKQTSHIDEAIRATKQAQRLAERQRVSAVNKAFNTRFQHHAQRGVALSIVGTLDERLKEAIQILMVDDVDVKRSMFSETGPLGSYGSRVRLGYLIGIYTKEVYEDLIKIGAIRNLFAHRSDVKDFTHQEVRSLCDKVKTLDALLEASTDETYLEEDTIIANMIARGYKMENMAYRFLAGVASLSNYVLDQAKSKRMTTESEA